MLRAFVFAALCVGLCGPQAEAKAKIDTFTSVHTIAIVSGIGDTLALRRAGLTIFSNAEADMPIADWGLDATVREKIAATLSQRFTVKVANAIPSEGLAKRLEDGEAFVKSLPPDDGIDAYILVRARRQIDPFRHTPVPLSGLGVFRSDQSNGFAASLTALLPEKPAAFNPPNNRNNDLGSEVGVFALYEILLVDARSGKTIASADSAVDDPDNLLRGTAPPFLSIHVGNWPEPINAMTDEQRKTIRRELSYLVRLSLTTTLRKCGLADR